METGGFCLFYVERMVYRKIKNRKEGREGKGRVRDTKGRKEKEKRNEAVKIIHLGSLPCSDFCREDLMGCVPAV